MVVLKHQVQVGLSHGNPPGGRVTFGGGIHPWAQHLKIDSLVSGWEGEIDYALVTPTQVLWCRSFFVPSSLVRL